MKIHLIEYQLVFVLLLAGCKPGSGNLSNKKSENQNTFSTAGNYQVTVVSEDLINSEFNRLIDSNFCSPFPGLGKYECEFSYLNIRLQEFNNTHSKNSSIVFIADTTKNKALLNFLQSEIADFSNNSSIGYYKNIWAYPQKIVIILGNSDMGTYTLLKKHISAIKDSFTKTEEQGIYKKVFLKGYNSQYQSEIKQKFNIQMQIPKAYSHFLNSVKFMPAPLTQISGFKKNTKENTLIFFIYELKLSECSQDSLIKIRNLIGKHYIKAENEGAYAETVIAPYPPEFSISKLDNDTITVIRGLWQTTSDWSGGPFLMYVMKDPAKNRIIVADGYVFAPTTGKRLLIRQLETIFSTVNFSE